MGTPLRAIANHSLDPGNPAEAVLTLGRRLSPAEKDSGKGSKPLDAEGRGWSVQYSVSDSSGSRSVVPGSAAATSLGDVLEIQFRVLT